MSSVCEFPDDILQLKNQIEARYGMYVYLINIYLYVKFDNDDILKIFTRVLPFFYTSSSLNFWFLNDNLLTKSQIEVRCGM